MECRVFRSDPFEQGRTAARNQKALTMKRFFSLSLAVLCCLCLVVATERRAYAYVDPGSGLLALQSFAAALAAAAYYMRRRIGALFGRGKQSPSTVTVATAKRENDSRSPARPHSAT